MEGKSPNNKGCRCVVTEFKILISRKHRKYLLFHFLECCLCIHPIPGVHIYRIIHEWIHVFIYVFIHEYIGWKHKCCWSLYHRISEMMPLFPWSLYVWSYIKQCSWVIWRPPILSIIFIISSYNKCCLDILFKKGSRILGS